jgi:DNA-binding NtrC family response regulator
MTAVRILLVDDDDNILKSLSVALKRAGYLVDTAESGKEAVEKANANFYNLALIDIRLPDMEGTGLITTTKERTPRTVKIMLTGYPTLQNAVEAVNRGADGYMIKPVQTEDLLKMVEEHLRRQEAAKQYSELKVKEYVETRIKEHEWKQSKNGLEGHT